MKKESPADSEENGTTLGLTVPALPMHLASSSLQKGESDGRVWYSVVPEQVAGQIPVSLPASQALLLCGEGKQ